MDDSSERNWALACHLSPLCMYIGIPFGNILGPLIIWLMKNKESEMIDEHGKESLNFQLSMTLYSLLALMLCFIFIGIIILPILMILNIVFIVIASIKCNQAESYSYPLTIRFIN